jgi:mycobactin peptide synthetase MbtE
VVAVTGRATADTVHEVFRARARQYPDRTALLHRAARVSYAVLDAASDRMADRLRDAGTRPGDLVPVAMPRSPQLVAVLLAILKAGAAYAALDPRWPPGRVRELAARLDARLVVGPEWAAPCPAARSWLPSTQDLTALASQPASAPPLAAASTSACCVFFTSGTTGEPKAIVSPHRATVRLFADCTFAELGPGHVMPQAAPLPWDGLTLELWSMLLSGGTSVLADDVCLTPQLLRELVRQHGVDIVWLTASLFNMAVEEDIGCFSGVRQLLIGGERLSVKHVRQLLTAHPDIRLTNGYGPAETCVFATTHAIRPADLDDADGVPVGRPVPGTEIFILDGERQCAPGEAGEICIAGDGLAHGYAGARQATAEKFVELPLGGRVRRVYRTGDTGCLSRSGVLHIRGRRDRQVKIRGHRIEPAEIEQSVMEVPGILRCVVEPLPAADGSTTGLVAFYACARTAVIPAAEIRQTMASRLPGYLIPREFRRVDMIPCTASGKVDHAELLRCYLADQAPARPAVRPQADARPSIPSA